jgi:esterase/lipase
MGYFIAFLLVVLAALFFGPRVEIDARLRPLTLPPDLDQYLADSESRFDDIVPHAEKTIIWAGEPGQKTDLSIVYLHGFSATRQETAPLSDKLAAALGANLFYTRFTGHGRASSAMGEATVNDWVNDTNEALAIGRRIGERVIVIGVSTGATAATWLAAQPDLADVLAFVLISPNYAVANGRAEILSWPWGEQFALRTLGSTQDWEPANEQQGIYWTQNYPTKALVTMMGMVVLARNGDLGGIERPCLVIYSPQDAVINPRRVEIIFEKIGSPDKKLIPFNDADDTSNHVLAGDILSPNGTEPILQMILDFVQEHR